MKYIVEKVNWYGYNHETVDAIFEGELSFVNTFCVYEEYHPVSVYKAKKPNTEKGHKKYMLLQSDSSRGCGIIRGMTAIEMGKWRYQQATVCLLCNKVIFSVNRHDYRKCGCPNETVVDGGREYLRYGGKDMTKIKLVTLDFLTNSVKVVRNKRKRHDTTR